MIKDAPSGARVFRLVKGSKRPATPRGHLDAKPVGDEFIGEEQNYGIALDGQFVLVDFDKDPVFLCDELDDPLHATIDLPGKPLTFLPLTWSQKTRRGYHYLYSVPEGFVGTNVKIPGGYGDIKCRGYLVGPGSRTVEKGEEFVYHILDSQEPSPAPTWLLDLCRDRRVLHADQNSVQSQETALQIREGEGRNQFLTRVAGSLRGLGLGVDQSKRVVRSVNGSVCSPPVSEAELRNTIDKSIEKWQQGEFEVDGPFVPSGWVSAADIPTVREPVRWWVWGFVPKGALVLNYGPGGIGKSTFAAWLAGVVTNKGGRFGIVTREDPFELFVDRARLSGVQEDLLFGAKSGDMSFPKDADKLRAVVEELQLDFLYFDAIYDHFDTKDGLHAGERTRQALSSLAKIAGDTGCTIMGTFHTNKSGEFMGSTEMENVSRVLLKATRSEAPGSPLVISVRKSNFKRPDFAMEFNLLEAPLVDKETGEPRLEENKEGTDEPAKLSYAVFTREQDFNSVRMDEVSEHPSKACEDLVLELLAVSPGMEAKAADIREAVLEQVDCSRRTFYRVIDKLKEEKAIQANGSTANATYKLV